MIAVEADHRSLSAPERLTRPSQVATIAVTAGLGTALLAAALAARPATLPFYALGVATGFVWVVGTLIAGGTVVTRRATRLAVAQEGAAGMGLGLVCFIAFFGARQVATVVPWLDNAVTGVLERADAGPRWAVMATAVVSGIGEEVYFRGGLYAVLPRRRRAVVSLLAYAIVTMATLNLALVAAALTMGAVFTAAREKSGGVLLPVVTHVTWSTLMIVALPR